jgi:hypothetical protein
MVRNVADMQHSMQNPELAQAIVAAAVEGRNYDPTNP